QPIMEAVHLPPGELHSQLMIESTTRDCMAVFTMQGEDLPQATNRVDFDPRLRDVWGTPAGRVTYSPHRHEAACADPWAPRFQDVMRVAGAHTAFWVTSPPRPGSEFDAMNPTPISRHVMGTARMGDDARTSVFDGWQRLHSVDNVLCTDSSVFPTSTGYGPTLTIVALALRACRALAGVAPRAWRGARWQAGPVVTLVFVLPRRPGLAEEEFHRYWREQHAPLVRKHADALGIRRYSQMHTLDTPFTEVIRSSRE